MDSQREETSVKISDILGAKGSDISTIRPEASLRELIEALADANVGALVVSSDGTTLEGIVSERDVVRSIVGQDTVGDRLVRDIMTSDVHTCGLDTTLDALRGEMTRRRIRHVPVVREGKLAGIVSIGDVVKSAIDQLEFERDQLNNYLNQ